MYIIVRWQTWFLMLVYKCIICTVGVIYCAMTLDLKEIGSFAVTNLIVSFCTLEDVSHDWINKTNWDREMVFLFITSFLLPILYWKCKFPHEPSCPSAGWSVGCSIYVGRSFIISWKISLLDGGKCAQIWGRAKKMDFLHIFIKFLFCLSYKIYEILRIIWSL